MCGLKVVNNYKEATSMGVTSFTDVWIESYDETYEEISIVVTSFTDVWIERDFAVNA